MIPADNSNVGSEMHIIANPYSTIALEITPWTSPCIGIDANIDILWMRHFVIPMNGPVNTPLTH